MLRRILIASALASLAVVGTATAAQAPTLGPVTIIKAGQKTPIDVAGNHLHQGATIRKGTELRRWLVTMHGASKANVTLKCGPGGTHVGLGLQEGARVVAALSKGSNYYHHTIKVHFYASPGVDPNGAHSSIYALCKTG
jgi:hypothetical protein